MLDRLNVVRNTLVATGCSSRALANFCDVATGSVTNYLSGAQIPDEGKLEKLYKVAQAIEKLSTLEVPIDWAKVSEIRPLVDKIIAGGSVEITVVEPPVRTESLFSIFLSGSYFQNRRKDALGRWQITTTRAPANAAIFNSTDAGKIKELLVASGLRAQIVPSREEYADSADDAWGENLEVAQ